MLRIRFFDYHKEHVGSITSMYYDLSVKRRDTNKLKQLDNWCKKYLSLEDDRDCLFKDVVSATPEKLIRYKKKLDDREDLDQINRELNITVMKTGEEKVSKSQYVVDTLYSQMNKEAKRFLLEQINIRVCPYCNRNYIVSNKDISTCQLDHFYPKSIYPIFAISFFNLIPCCAFCNNKKRDNMFGKSPYLMTDQDEEMIQFSFEPKRADFLVNSDSIKVKINAREGSEELEILQLSDIYSLHNDIVGDILKKHEIYNETYIKSLQNEFSQLFTGINDVRELIYGTPMERERMNNRPLSKLTNDILRELDNQGIGSDSQM